jgi:hypothetical protein
MSRSYAATGRPAQRRPALAQSTRACHQRTNVTHAGGLHGLQQVHQAADVVLVVLQRLGHRLAHRLQCARNKWVGGWGGGGPSVKRWVAYGCTLPETSAARLVCAHLERRKVNDGAVRMLLERGVQRGRVEQVQLRSTGRRAGSGGGGDTTQRALVGCAPCCRLRGAHSVLVLPSVACTHLVKLDPLGLGHQLADARDGHLAATARAHGREQADAQGSEGPNTVPPGGARQEPGGPPACSSCPRGRARRQRSLRALVFPRSRAHGTAVP